MSTSLGRNAQGHLRPGLVVALVKVALIGTWRGRTFLDDDADLSDIADFVPADEPVCVTVTPAPASAPATLAAPDPAPTTHPDTGGSHPVAA